jgi:hypothetical protein
MKEYLKKTNEFKNHTRNLNNKILSVSVQSPFDQAGQ